MFSFAAASHARRQSPADHLVIALDLVAHAESWYLDANAGDLDVFITPQGTRSSIWTIRDPGLAIDSDLGRWRLIPSALLTMLRKGVEAGLCFVRPKAPEVLHWMTDLSGIGKAMRANVGQIG